MRWNETLHKKKRHLVRLQIGGIVNGHFLVMRNLIVDVKAHEYSLNISYL